MNAITVSYISSGLEIGWDILDSTETIVERHKLARPLLILSAHKIYGPKGIGALYVRREDGQYCFAVAL